MAQSNALREQPSMEEILASIRKIIEDGEDRIQKRETGAAEISAESTTITPPSARVPSDNMVRLQPKTSDESEFSADDLDNFVASLDQRAAQIEPEFEDAQMVEPQFEDESEAFAAFEDDGFGASDDVDPVEDYVPAFTRPAVHKPANSDQPSANDLGRPLVSQAASLSIAASLRELDSVLAERSGRDIEGVTEDMLRPMLSEWLDNNLPSIVERLVRQEIERIARGE